MDQSCNLLSIGPLQWELHMPVQSLSLYQLLVCLDHYAAVQLIYVHLGDGTSGN